MTFQDDLQDDLDNVFFSDFAQTGEYNGVEIDFVETETSDLTTSVPGYVLPAKQVYVKSSDVSRPKAGDVLVIGEVSYRVGQGARMDGDGVWWVPLSQIIGQAT